MVPGDIEAGLKLCRSAGWNQLEEDWRIFLDLSPNGNAAAVNDSGDVVGTAATVIYEDRFAWIGMVLVDPAYKRQGIGTKLLEQTLDILRDVDTVKLDATPAGREVYLKLGFRDEYVLSRMVVENPMFTYSDAADSMTEKDFPNIFSTDKNVFGASREVLLQNLLNRYRQGSFVIRSKENISGYSFARKGYNFTQIGPVVTEQLHDAIRLTSTALKNITGGCLLDVMHGSPFYEWLLSIGFTEQRKLIRMFKGSNKFPGNPSKQFAILGPEFG